MKQKTITNTPEVAEAVRRLFAEGKTGDQVRAWLLAEKAKGKHADIWIPADMRDTKKALGIESKHGGARKNCTGAFAYKVTKNGRAVQ